MVSLPFSSEQVLVRGTEMQYVTAEDQEWHSTGSRLDWWMPPVDVSMSLKWIFGSCAFSDLLSRVEADNMAM